MNENTVQIQTRLLSMNEHQTHVDTLVVVGI